MSSADLLAGNQTRPENQARTLLDAILAAFAERNVPPTPLTVICAATDAGADDELATLVADLFNRETQEA